MVDLKTYCIDRKNPTKTEKWNLYFEVNGQCPLCGDSLAGTKKGKDMTCEIAHIFPCNPTAKEKVILANVPVAGKDSEDLKNKIALCKKCHNDYDYHKTESEYMNLFEIKQSLIKETDANFLLSKQPIESKLIDVIKKISSISILSIDSMTKIKYDALNIRQKIPNNKVLFIKKIENDVLTYYLKIRELFQEQNNPKNSFEAISLNIKHSYTLIKETGQSEENVYNELVQWIQSKTNCSKEASCILVSFFVQNCEIYDKLSE